MEDLTIHKAYILVAIEAAYTREASPTEVFYSIKKMLYPFAEHYSVINISQILRGEFSKKGLVDKEDGSIRRPRYDVTEEGSQALKSYINGLLKRGVESPLSFEEILLLYSSYSNKSVSFSSRMLQKLKAVMELAVCSFEEPLRKRRHTPYITHLLLKNNLRVLKTILKEVLP